MCLSTWNILNTKCWASKGFDGELKLQPTSLVAKRDDEDEDEDDATYLHAAWSILGWTDRLSMQVGVPLLKTVLRES